GEAKTATAFATSAGLPTRCKRTIFLISVSTSLDGFLCFSARLFTICDNLSVLVAPGTTLLTVIPNVPNSLAKVLDQLATAPLTVFDTPRLSNGIFTDVEIIFIILP